MPEGRSKVDANHSPWKSEMGETGIVSATGTDILDTAMIMNGS